MDPNTLSQFYDNLKSNLNQSEVQPVPAVPSFDKDRKMFHFHKVCHDHANCLKDKCRKHILLDIYMKCLPLDDEWKDGHTGILKNDIDQMLAAKDATPTQYLTSAFESTKAPFLEYILRCTDTIADLYLEATEEDAKQADADGIDVTEPEEPSEDDPDVSSQLVDITKDTDYDTFVDTLKKKTIDKIVADVSELIDGEKEKNDMTFDTTNESAVIPCMNYLTKRMMQEQTEINSEEALCLSIREATLYELSRSFKMVKSYEEFTSIIGYGKGILINESAVSYLKEHTTPTA